LAGDISEGSRSFISFEVTSAIWDAFAVFPAAAVTFRSAASFARLTAASNAAILNTAAAWQGVKYD
jgi:hypothetical protein